MSTLAMPGPGRLTLAGLCAWVLVSLPTAVNSTHSPRLLLWLAASFGYAIAFVAATWRPPALGQARALLALQAGAVTAMMGLLCNGFEGALLVLGAAQLGLRMRSREAALWIAAQTATAGTAIALHWSPRPALLLMPPYLGLQIFAYLSLRLLARETEARLRLGQAHAQVLALQDQLSQRARLDERLHIAQDLHDALGHHLTAMSLNLEAAAHQTTGVAQASVRTAQSLARTLLHDVRQLARSLKADEPVDLELELARLAREVPAPRIHLSLPQELRLEPPALAGTLLRCVQEIVSNAIRHGAARNLWIELTTEPSGLSLSARDDGRGAAVVEAGLGLDGIRRRVEELGGSLAIESGPGAGFALRALLPAARAR